MRHFYDFSFWSSPALVNFYKALFYSLIYLFYLFASRTHNVRLENCICRPTLIVVLENLEYIMKTNPQTQKLVNLPLNTAQPYVTILVLITSQMAVMAVNEEIK